MTFPLRRFAPAPLAVILLAVAGCGTNSGSPTISTPPTSGPSTVPTIAVPPTVPIKGGSVAAVVNGQKVPMSEYKFLFRLSQYRAGGAPSTNNRTLAQETMNQIIADEIVRQYAAAHHISVSSKELNSRLQQDVTQSGGSKAFDARLKQYGLTHTSYSHLLANDLLMQKVAAVIAPFSSKPEEYAHARHILILTHTQAGKPISDSVAHATALKVLHLVQKNPGNFAALAKKYSQDTGSAVQGGDLGNLYPNQTVPQFNYAIFHLPIHKIALIKSVYGYHIIEVLARGKAPLPTQQQQQQQQQKFEIWLNKQVTTAHVKRIASVG